MDADNINNANRQNSYESCEMDILNVAEEVCANNVGSVKMCNNEQPMEEISMIAQLKSSAGQPTDSLSEAENNICKTNATEFVIVALAEDCSENKASNVKINNGFKDELAESVTANIDCTNHVLDSDPMGLLELTDRSDINSFRSDRGDQDDGDDESVSTESSSAHTTSSSSNSNSNNTLEYLKNQKEYSWLLHEESDDMYGYCLYCDVNLNVRSVSSVKQHGLSLYHKERSDNYLAFCEEEERNGFGTPLAQIKQEFGTDNYIAALKLKRKTQCEALNNYNWRQWLDQCPWLERQSPAGTIGYCKYCEIQLNVEFSYLRNRHQETGKHKECAKRYEQGQLNAIRQKHLKSGESQDSLHSRSDDRHRWCQPDEEDNNSVRCKLCDIKMAKNNFARHLRSNSHLQNEKMYIKSEKREQMKKSSQESEEVIPKTPPIWSMYSKNHPWLTANPSDNNYAFCKYCEKRILYGNSVAKRVTHENSIQHKHFEKMYKEKMGKAEIGNVENGDINNVEEEEHDEESEQEEQDEDEEENGTDEDNDTDEDGKDVAENKEGEDEEAEEPDDIQKQDDDQDHDNNDNKKRISRNDSEWYEQYPWCKKYKIDPVNYCFCSYCKIAIGKSCRKKHSITARHLVAETEFLKRHNRKKSLLRSKNSDEGFDWAVDIKSHPNLYYCKYCRVRISRHYSKKQHAVSKIHQINENLFKTNRKSIKAKENTPQTENQNRSESSPLITKQPVVKTPSLITLVKQWQKRSPWLTYKRNELRSNYAFCKVCNQSLYIRSIKNVLKHQRSSKHIRTVNQLRRQKLQQEREEEEAKIKKANKKCPKLEVELNTTLATDDTQKENERELNDNINNSSKEIGYNSNVGEMQKRFSWIEKSKKNQYAYCRYCDTDVVLKILFLRKHTNSRQHREAVINHRVAKTKSEKRRLCEFDAENEEDSDILLVEDNTEEILISEQDDNWTIKSENMDEHEELDYLLQRFGKTNDNNELRQGRKYGNAEDRLPKRVKRSHSFRRGTEGHSSLVASILSTPLTLASCLGPLIKQQIQQVTSTQAQQSGTSQVQSTTDATNTDNSFDLFFKSISESMKKLPSDLATEGKLKVMQIICDLELKALKRQQSNIEIESTGSKSNLGVNSLGSNNLYNPNTPTENIEASTRNMCDRETIPQVQSDKVSNESSPLYTNTNASPTRTLQHQICPTTATTSLTITPTDGKKEEKGMNINQSPIIGVMDKNGLHTLQFKNTTVVKKVPTATIAQKSGTNIVSSSIRCIPFKNLTQSVSAEGNTKITRIQVPIPTTTSTSQILPSTSNMTATSITNKGVLNVRNIHIGKMTTAPHQQVVCTSASQLTPTVISEQNAQGSYITGGNVQRWTTVHGSSLTPSTLKQGHNSNFNLLPKQTSTPISRNCK